MSARRRAASALFAAALASGTAWADVTDVSAVRSRVGLEGAGATFALRGLTGSYLTAAALAELAPSSTVSIRARIPYTRVTYAGDDGGTHAGLGDVELRLRWRLLPDDPFQASIGLGGSAPTSRGEHHLGDDTAKIAPFATGGYRTGRTVIFATVSDQISIPIAPRDEVGDITDPASDHELRGDLGVIERFGPVFVSAYASGAARLVSRGPGNFAYGTLLIGATPSANVRLVVGAALPITGEHRFDARTTGTMLVTF